MSQSLTALYLQNPELANALRKREAGQAMLQQGSDSSPVEHWAQGAARLAQALVGGYETGQADKEFKGAADKRQKMIASLFSDDPATPAMAMPPQPAQPQMPMTAPQPQPGARMPAAGSSELMGMVAPIAQQYGVPLSLAMALVQQESGGNPGAVGDGGQSVGLGQIQARTAADPGYGVAPMDPAKRTDPTANLDFAMRYLVGKGRHFGATDLNDPAHQDIALKAYNGGGDPNYVQNVRGRMQPGDAIPVAAGAPQPGQGAPQAPQGMPQAGGQGDYLAMAERLQRRAQAAAAAGETALATQFQNQATTYRQMALQKPQTEMVVVPDPSSSSGYRYVPRGQAGGMAAPEPRPMVSIQNTGESAYERERAQTFSGRVKEWEDANVKSAQTLNRLTQMEKALDQFSTGAMSGTILKAGQIAQRLNVPSATLEALGINPEQVASGETIRSLASQMLVGMIGSGGFPAQGFSNADREMLERALPGLANSPQGNKMIIQIMRASAQRDMEIGKAWRDWSRTKGDSLNSVRGFQSEILPGIVERNIVAPILEQGGWTEPAAGPGGGAPQPGTVENGYRFRGGDPSKPESWERVQ